jgi:hypothetical protein
VTIANAARSAALGSMPAILQSPLARAVVKYWWVTVPIGYAAWVSYQRRKAKEGKVHPIDVLHDVAPIIGIVGTLVAVNATIAAHEAKATANAAQAAANSAPRAVQAQVRATEYAAPPPAAADEG